MNTAIEQLIKPGDKVRLLVSNNTLFKIGKVYTVVDSKRSVYSDQLLFIMITDMIRRMYIFDNQVELVTNDLSRIQALADAQKCLNILSI